MVWPPPWPGGGDAGVSSSGGAPPNKFCRVGVRATRVVGRKAVAYAARTASASRAILAAVLSDGSEVSEPRRSLQCTNCSGASKQTRVYLEHGATQQCSL